VFGDRYDIIFKSGLMSRHCLHDLFPPSELSSYLLYFEIPNLPVCRYPIKKYCCP